MDDPSDILAEPDPSVRDAIGARRARTTEGLARIAAALGAQRAEVYARADDEVRLAAWWAAFGHDVGVPGETEPMPIDWFPWTLGNIRNARHVFVRNAGPLPLRPGGPHRISDIGMGSSLYLPVQDGLGVVGGLCAYWVAERAAWPSEAVDHLADLARDCLLGGG
jgi:hypothetical protein